MASSESNKSLKRYYIVFGITLIVYNIILAIIGTYLEGSSMSGVKFITPFLAAMLTGEHFLKRELRLPTFAEKNHLVIGGLIIFIILNSVSFVAVWLNGEIETGALFLMVIVILILVAIVNYFLMAWAYGGLLEKRAKKLNIEILGNSD